MHVQVPQDVRLAASLRLLSVASKALAASFDFVATLTRVAEIVVPEFARGITLEIGGDTDSRSEFVTRGTLERAHAHVFPLVAHNQQVGCMLVATADAAPIDRELFDELALRIAVSMDGAQIYGNQATAAGNLQRAFLPDRLPQLERYHFDAAYVPCADDAIVVGDWYDAFTLPDGRVAISVGDVAGHGLRAAIVMGEVRQAFRNAALDSHTPSEVLDRANEIVNLRAQPVMVTAIFGVIDPATSTFRYASAGHPGPILTLSDGTALRMPTGGIPLGIADSTESADWAFTLPSGGLIALYTDGLIEYSRDVIDGEARLFDALRAEILAPSRTPARALLDRIFTNCTNNDDVAALVISVDDPPNDDFVFDFSAVALAVPLVRRALQRYGQRLQLGDEHMFALVTAVGEAMANAVEHGSGNRASIVGIRTLHREGQLITTIASEGAWRPQNVHEERGRGLPLMRALMSSVHIETDSERTLVRLTLELGERPHENELSA